MSKKYPAGVITKSPVTPTGPYQDGVASGVWSMEQMEYWMKQGLWPIAGNANPGDPYFDYVTMLLNGDGTNGAQNNTFLDSSTNAFTITRNGNTTQGSFSPYGSLWGNYFDGSGDYLTVAQTTNLDLPSDFTIEFWTYLTATSDTTFIGKNGSGGQYAWLVQLVSGNIRFVIGNSGTIDSLPVFTWGATIGQWYHVAVTRSGSSIKVFINGTQIGTTVTNSSNCTSTASTSIGMNLDGIIQPMNGYISNLRVVKGTALYTANFTPSTTPLTAVSGTSLLTCQSNRFIDNSSNAFALTVNGTPSVQRFSPFNPTASYSTATIGGSGYFDGSGDYLQTPTSSSFTLAGSSNWQIDFWYYPTATPAQYSGPFGTTNANGIFFSYRSGTLDFTNGNDNAGTIVSPFPTLNAWSHIVLVNNGSTNQRSVFINGVRTGTYTSNYTFTNDAFYVTSYPASTAKGYISNFRVQNGARDYDPASSTITVPSAPTTSTASTVLLLNFTNAGIPDSAMMNDLETVGNAQVSTSVKKFGTGSISFDGSGDRLVTQTDNTLFNLGSGDFTIEGWIYPTTLNFYHSIINNDAGTSSGTRGFSLSVNSSGAVSFFYSTNGSSEASVDTSGSVISTNNWYHIAVSRSSGTTKIFVNGTQQASGTVSTINFASSYPVMIGDNPQTTTPFYGYIDDLRITKGYARYTSSFTPPTAAFYTY